jgi:hypothetical protein
MERRAGESSTTLAIAWPRYRDVMQASSLPALVISLVALAISAYGVGERMYAVKRAERLRFASIIDELSSLHLEHMQAEADLADGDVIDALNSRRELLVVQALSMRKRLGQDVTSPELRTLAHALGRAGYPTDAEEMWAKAVTVAQTEGRMQSLFAHRGYAYFLFGEGRPEDARQQMRRAVDVTGSADDASTIHQIKSLKYWSDAELQENPADPRADELITRARQSVDHLQTAKARQQMLDFLASPTGPADRKPR